MKKEQQRRIMKSYRRTFLFSVLSTAVLSFSQCSDKSKTDPVPPPPPPAAAGEVDWWLSTSDQAALLSKQSTALSFGTVSNSYPYIDVDSVQTFQPVDGFGYTLTGASASLISSMNSTQQSALLNELFGNGTTGIGISYLRVSIGASDLNTSVFSYNDLPPGQTDTLISQFSFGPDLTTVIPVLQQALAINPSLKIMGSPWSAPVWMKDNNNTMGGHLQPQYYRAYARYFVKYIQEMKAKGITIDAVTLQNEPEHGGNNPSMLMSAAEQADFVKNHLGPAFQSAGLTTKIIVWDHNCDNPNYPITVLNDAAAKAYINGSAFHLYGGDISALSTVKNAHPDKALYFTEQWTSSAGDFSGDLKWHLKNVIIGSMRNWSRNALEWNLANDPAFAMHTPGGCTQCKGALTINGSTYTRNVSYYIVAHASKFVPAGSVRIESNLVSGLPNAAFLTPSGKKVLIVVNEGSSGAAGFNIRFKGKWAYAQLNAGSAATFIW